MNARLPLKKWSRDIIIILIIRPIIKVIYNTMYYEPGIAKSIAIE